MSALKEIKAAVYNHFAHNGITSDSLVKSTVKHLTGNGDLRRIETWYTALVILATKVVRENTPSDLTLSEVSAPSPVVSVTPVKAVASPVVSVTPVKAVASPVVPVSPESIPMRYIGDRNGYKVYLGGIAA